MASQCVALLPYSLQPSDSDATVTLTFLLWRDPLSKTQYQSVRTGASSRRIAAFVNCE
jgi:hypothetical protein